MPHIRSRTSKSTKENDERKGGKREKDTQDGKGKDHQLSQPSRQTTLQPKSRDLVMAATQAKTTTWEGARRNGRFPRPSGGAACVQDNRR